METKQILCCLPCQHSFMPFMCRLGCKKLFSFQRDKHYNLNSSQKSVCYSVIYGFLNFLCRLNILSVKTKQSHFIFQVIFQWYREFSNSRVIGFCTKLYDTDLKVQPKRSFVMLSQTVAS